MPISCVAFNCKNKQRSGDRSLRFHKFPFSRPHILVKWIHAVRRGSWVPTKYSRLCSEHFEEDSYQLRPGAHFMLLKETAVPTIFDFSPHVRHKNSSNRRHILRRIAPAPVNMKLHDSPLQGILWRIAPAPANMKLDDNPLKNNLPRIAPANMKPNECPLKVVKIPMKLWEKTRSSLQISADVTNTVQLRRLRQQVQQLRKTVRILQARLRRRNQTIMNMRTSTKCKKKKFDSFDDTPNECQSDCEETPSSLPRSIRTIVFPRFRPNVEAYVNS